MDLYAIAEHLVMHYGYIGIFLISFTEAFIQPIPPDIFIIGASYFGLNPIISALIATIGTTLGGLFGYFLGNRLGHPIFIKLFGEKYLKKGEEFFDRYGVYGVIISGFSPLPYKIIAWLAGIFEMDKLLFTVGTIIGRLPRFLIVAYFGNVLGNVINLSNNITNININNINIWIFYLINSHHNSLLDLIMLLITKTVYPIIALTSVFFLIKDRKFGVKLISALIVSIVLVYLLKYSINEPRPYFVLKNIHLLCYKGHEPSFPSGHTALAFTLSTSMLLSSKKKFKKLGFLFLIWAIFVAYSRVYVGVHYPIDVFGGAIIGVTCGYLTLLSISLIRKKLEKLIYIIKKKN